MSQSALAGGKFTLMFFRFLVQSLIWGLGDTLRKLQSSNFSISKHVYLVMGGSSWFTVKVTQTCSIPSGPTWRRSVSKFASGFELVSGATCSMTVARCLIIDLTMHVS